MTRRLTFTKLVLTALCTTMLLAACGSSSSNGASSADGKKYVAAMVASFDKSKAAGSDVPFTRDQVKCLSGKMVDAIGADELKKAGVTTKLLSGTDGLDAMGKRLNTAQAAKVADAFFGGDCFDVTKLLATEFKGSFKGQTSAAINCLADEVVKLAVFKKSFVDSILGKSGTNPFAGAGANALLPIFTKCKIDVSKLSG